MKRVLLGLILILAVSGFVIAKPTSDIRTDFYVSALAVNSPGQNFFLNFLDFKSLVFYGIIGLIVVAIVVVILRKFLKSNRKIPKKKIRRIKKARRKK